MCYHVEFVFSASQGVGISREEAQNLGRAVTSN